MGNYIPKEFNEIKGEILIDTVASQPGDTLLVYQNDHGCFALNKRTDAYFYIATSLLQDDSVFKIETIDTNPFHYHMVNKQKALRYCEWYGITPYKITNQWLIYYTNYPAYLAEPRRSYKVRIRLSDLQEFRQELKKWSPLGDANLRK